MITKGQFFRHKTEWNEVCAVRGWSPNDDTVRLQFYRDNGLPESRSDWNTRGHFDTFLAACKEAKGIRTGGPQRTDDDGERRRLVWRITEDAKKAGLNRDYIVHLARDLHVLGNFEDLDLPSLQNLMRAIHNRAGKKLGRDTRTRPARRRYVLDAVPRMFSHAKEERHMPTRQRKPATVMGPTPVAPPLASDEQDDNQPF